MSDVEKMKFHLECVMDKYEMGFEEAVIDDIAGSLCFFNRDYQQRNIAKLVQCCETKQQAENILEVLKTKYPDDWRWGTWGHGPLVDDKWHPVRNWEKGMKPHLRLVK